MRAPHVLLRDQAGRVHRVGPGGLIGRAETAACRLEDPRVSEVHAMVSLRGRELRLLQLRGVIALDGIEDDDFPLEAGQQIGLAPEVSLRVESVELPERLLAIRVGGLRPRELRAPLYSVVTAPELELVARYIEGAPARIWSTARGWTIQLGGAPSQPIRPGRSWRIEGLSIQALALPLEQAGSATTLDRAARYAPLRLVTRYTSAHLIRERRQPVIVNGQPAKLLTELVRFASPVHWAVVAGEIWPDETDDYKLRKRMDRVRYRLTEALREAGIRDDLVRSDGSGNVELLILPGDEVVDES